MSQVPEFSSHYASQICTRGIGLLNGEEESVLSVPLALRLFQEPSREQKLLLPHRQNNICFRAVVLSGPHMDVYSSQKQYSLGMKFTSTFNSPKLNSPTSRVRLDLIVPRS